MNVNQVTVSGFRNVKKCTLNFDELISLVSTNNYGKSNALGGIDFGIDFIKASEIGKKNMMAWVKGIPLNKELASENYKINLELSTEINNTFYDIKYGYEFKWYRNDGTGSKIIGEYLKLKRDTDKRYSTYIDRNETNSYYKSSDTGRCNSKINISDYELILNKLKAFDDLYYIEIINELNKMKTHIERHLDASSSYDEDPFVRKDRDVLDLENSNNIPRMIYYLKEQNPDKFNLLINSFMQLFPEITKVEVKELKFNYNKKDFPEDIPFRIANAMYRIMVVDKNLNQPINFDSMSDGAKRIFLQLATIIISEMQGYSIIAIEEPENSIHPLLFQSYLRIIEQFKGKCKIIITSYSPYLLKYLKTSNIYIGIPNKYGIARFSTIKKSKIKQLEEFASKYGISIGDYIFELLNGTEEDLEELKELLEEEKE